MIVCAIDDLLFSIKIKDAAKHLGVELYFERSADRIVDTVRDKQPSLVIFDLNSARLDPLRVIAQLKSDPETRGIKTLGFVSHVHADTIAAWLGGSQQLVTSLALLEIADICFSDLVDDYAGWSTENVRPENAYSQLRGLTWRYGKRWDIPVEDGLLKVTQGWQSPSVSSRVIVADQWASHPSRQDRERNLLQLGFQADMVKDSAWRLFREPENLQIAMTEKLFPKRPSSP